MKTILKWVLAVLVIGIIVFWLFHENFVWKFRTKDSRQIEKYESYLNNFPNGKYASEANYQLGEIYLEEGDTIKAEHCFKESIINGNNSAWEPLLNIYENKNKEESNFSEVEKWLLIAAEKDYERALDILMELYNQRKKDEINYTKAHTLMLKSAKEGDARAQARMGDFYYRTIAPNYAEAKAWYEKGAEQGNEFAQYGLATMYDNGNGVLKNDTMAFDLYEKSASQGHGKAQLMTGVKCLAGNSFPRDTLKALNWLTLSGEQGEERAQYWVGMIYLKGCQDVVSDTIKAIEWLKLAANQNEPRAQEQLIKLKANGPGPRW